jgi:colicin import membrane protein
VSFTETDFYLQQQSADRGWPRPLVLALALHVSVLAGSALLPGLLHNRPILDEVVTVNLVSLPDTAPPQEAPQERPQPPPPAEPEPVAKIEPAKAEIPLEPEPQVVEKPPAPVKPVSLKPIARKVKKTDPAKIAAEKARQERERQRQQEIARARIEEERARREAERARAALAEMIRQKNSLAGPAPRSSTGTREVRSIVFKQYLSTLYDRVQQYWILPDMRRWDPALETVVVLTIRRDGSVVNTRIEKKATDPFFDQFVKQTIQKAMPMPPFPTLMSQASIEVGFRFRPGELLM